MQKPVPSRKRPAPGASPLVQQPMTPQTAFHYQQMPENADFSVDLPTAFKTDEPYFDAAFNDPNVFAAALNATHSPTFGSGTAPTPTTDLVRRARNHQLAPQNNPQEVWDGGNVGGMNGKAKDEEEEEDLNLKVALAKSEAQGKRKQIPPFVQKLSSFLDSNNTDLIRWSDDGRSFIVLDEDEFARTLIPELFKHNNYASFVRQLNMYGFHKTVNITDGSLRQSEKARKGVKPPSMYSHPYFRKNRPDLLWLIQKPSAKSNAKRKRDGAVKGEGVDSDDERQYSPGPDGRPGGELGAPGSQGLTQLPRNEINSLRQELKKLQSQQNIISRMIGQLKEQNEQFYRQATAFQQLHDRHENSINAILTFLATFYNRSLEGHPGQNLVNMFSNQSQSTQQQQRGVVEEFNDTHPVTNGEQTHRFVKKPQLLLGAPNGTSGPYARTGGIITESNSRIQSTSPPDSNSPPAAPQTQAGVAAGRTSGSPVIKDDAQTPKVESVPENDQMMSLINSANANNATSDGTPAFDLSALGNYSTAHGLTPQQRSNMLAMINQHGGDSSTNNNALVSPNPPSMQQHMDNIKQNQQQIAQLEQLQKQQDQSVGQLQDHIARLSPGGFNPSEFDGNAIDLVDDINQWLNTDGAETNLDFDFPTTAEGTHSDFDFDSFAAGDDTGADMFQTDVKAVAEHDHLTAPTGTIESLSSESTSPANTNPAGEDTPVPELLHDGPKKKRRTSY